MEGKQIREALRMQPLTEEDRTQRHILGRLAGPIATCKESTRNGRKYNRQLWENALNDDIFKEKVANKSLFLELGHPTDREETDMTKVCACIPEMPKIIGDDLYAYVDILDTPNGALLKKFIDYGFRPGISSRGSGDIMDNDEVDPDTFFLETWDIVQLPAVKKARLNVCESLDTEKLGLRKALKESLDSANEEDRKIMKEALDNLNIDLKEEDEEVLENGTPVNDEDIPMADETNDQPGAPEDLLTEAADDEEPVEEPEENTEAEAEEATDDKEAEADTEAETDEEAEEETEDADIATVGDIVKALGGFDEKAAIEFAPITIEDKEYNIDLFIDGDDDKVMLGVNCTPIEDDSKNIEATADELPEEENPEVPVAIDASSDDVEVAEPEVAEEPADDVGDDEVMESFKDLVRQKDLLESENKALKKSIAVSNAEAGKLKEELERYKSGFVRTSELASQATKAKKEVASLTEQLAQKDDQINTLNKKVAEKVELKESVNTTNAKVTKLTEQLNTATENEKILTEQVAQYKQRLSNTTEQAKNYRAKFTAVLNRYIESKAKMLGVRPSDITNRLNESYTLDDIDNVCDNLIESTVNVGKKLPFNTKQVKAKINESVNRKDSADPEDYDLSDLYELAGIKF